MTSVSETPLTHLQQLVGAWQVDVRLTLPDGSTQAGQISAVGTAISHGQGVHIRISGDLPGLGPVEENDLWGYDAGGDLVHAFSITSMGEVHDHAGRFTDDRTLTLQWRGRQDGQEAVEDLTLTFVSPTEWHNRSVTVVGGQAGPTLEATFRKQ